MFQTRMCMYWNAFPVLAVIQILVGLLNIGLGPGRTSMHPGDLANLGAAYWLGAVDIITGIVSIIANCCYSPGKLFLLIFAVTVNIISSIYAIIGIVLYALDLRDASFIQMCPQSQPSDQAYATNWHNECQFMAYVAQSLVVDMDITLIFLTVLQLSASVALTALGIMALCGRWKEKGVRDAEVHQPILKEVLMISPEN